MAAKLTAAKNTEGLIIIGAYMPCSTEDAPLKDKLRTHMAHMMNTEYPKATVIIMGDFNARLLPEDYDIGSKVRTGKEDTYHQAWVAQNHLQHLGQDRPHTLFEQHMDS